MHASTHNRFFAAALLTAVLLAAPAAARARKAQPAPLPPSSTTATFEDWTLHCVQKPEAPHVCEVTQSLHPDGQTQVIAQIAIGRIEPQNTLQLTVVTPTNVHLHAAPHVVIDTAEVDLVWQRCIPGACFADIALAKDATAQWQRAQSGTISYIDGAGRPMKLAFSTHGLAAALSAMNARQPRP